MDASRSRVNTVLIASILNIILLGTFILGGMKWITETTSNIQRVVDTQVQLTQALNNLNERLKNDELKLAGIETRHVAEDITGHVNKPIH
jgi:hypothetical protein